jgi:hypothetical protein
MVATGGISEIHCRRVDELHRRFQDPFSVAEAAELFGLDRPEHGVFSPILRSGDGSAEYACG